MSDATRKGLAIGRPSAAGVLGDANFVPHPCPTEQEMPVTSGFERSRPGARKEALTSAFS